MGYDCAQPDKVQILPLFRHPLGLVNVYFFKVIENTRVWFSKGNISRTTPY